MNQSKICCMLSLLFMIFLILLQCGDSKKVCYKQISHATCRKYCQQSSSTTISYICGRWWSRRTCYKQITTYSSNCCQYCIVYSRVRVCCNGYSNYPRCSSTTCFNGICPAV